MEGQVEKAFSSVNGVQSTLPTAQDELQKRLATFDRVERADTGLGFSKPVGHALASDTVSLSESEAIQTKLKVDGALHQEGVPTVTILQEEVEHAEKIEEKMKDILNKAKEHDQQSVLVNVAMARYIVAHPFATPPSFEKVMEGDEMVVKDVAIHLDMAPEEKPMDTLQKARVIKQAIEGTTDFNDQDRKALNALVDMIQEAAAELLSSNDVQAKAATDPKSVAQQRSAQDF